MEKCKCRLCTHSIDRLIRNAGANGLNPKLLKKYQARRKMEWWGIMIASSIVSLLLTNIFDVGDEWLYFIFYIIIYTSTDVALKSVNDATWRDWIKEGKI